MAKNLSYKTGINYDYKSPEINSALFIGPLDSAINTFNSNGYNLISMKELTLLKMSQIQNGEGDSSILNNCSMVKEGCIYLPGKGHYITKDSPILNHMQEAKVAYDRGGHFELAEYQIEEALRSSVKIPSPINLFGLNSRVQIPTKKLGEEEVTQYLLGGGLAEEYGNLLNDMGIPAIDIFYDCYLKKSSAMQLIAYPVGGVSKKDLFFISYDTTPFDSPNLVRGIKYYERK